MIKLSWKIWLLIGVLMGSILLISPSFEKGVVIKADGFSKQAKEKIEKAGGKAIALRAKKI